MNKRQLLVLILILGALFSIYKYTPRYKIVKIDSENFIRTEQSSPLYARTKAPEKLNLDKVVKYSIAALLTGGLIFVLLRRSK